MKIRLRFDKQHLFIGFRIRSTDVYSKAKYFNGIIDTGFSGFVMMPQDQFSGLGLFPKSITTVRTADGKYHDAWTDKCKIYIGRTPFIGPAMALPDVSYTLYGMELLEKADAILMLDFKKGILELSN